MTRPAQAAARTPTRAGNAVLTQEEEHLAGVCRPGCPWCGLSPWPADQVAIIDEEQPQPETP